MTDKDKLNLIKTIHTAVWLVMASAVIYIIYAGIFSKFGILLWISIALLLLESAVLLINKWTCPLTPMAGKYTSERTENFDIYLPRILAKYNKIIFGSAFIVGLTIVILRIIISMNV